MLNLVTDIKLEIKGLGMAVVSLYWNSVTEMYHVEARGVWPDSWDTAKDDIYENFLGAWAGYAARVYKFNKKGMVPVSTEWR